ncbi:glycosyltransferase involved in cell wall biosynthesis [Salinibacter ruber]|uniref:glycosyltransferase family 4 protein n=1 Tax=Salinibacter ruber TaxID=146919 RepID=UPI002168DE64|nr:glycosyltransferase family 4 protein [Salinibacter ruber]MCS3826470.1 glycosyltransferase involved in cell wall biosynthesis [Salinibacter ruber]
MRVLLISQYFPPETGGPPNRLLSIANGLREAGHEVHVIAEKPNHPEGVIREDYREGVFDERTYDGIPVTYTWVYTDPEKNFLKRLSFYLSFMVMAVVGALRTKGDFDVVLASSPPLFVGLSGWLAARLKDAKFVFDVRDIWPEVAVAMGALTNPVAIRLAERLERFIYNRADGVTAVTSSFCNHIQDVASDQIPMRRVMNGTMPDVFQQDAQREKVQEKLGVDGKYVVTYAGNHGLAQGLPHLIEAADLLQDNEDVEFVLLGSGPVKENLIQEATSRELDNVRFLDRVPLEEAAAHMAASDALLVPLEDHEIYRQFIPSKLFDSMASGRPVLLSVDGEARSILEEAEGGLYYPAEDGEALAERIEWLVEHPEEGEKMGERGRAYAQENCTRTVQARKMADFLEQIADT